MVKVPSLHYCYATNFIAIRALQFLTISFSDLFFCLFGVCFSPHWIVFSRHHNRQFFLSSIRNHPSCIIFTRLVPIINMILRFL